MKRFLAELLRDVLEMDRGGGRPPSKSRWN